MIPSQALTDSPLVAAYLFGEPAYSAFVSPLVDVEPGGIAVGDPSGGLYDRLWTLSTPDGHAVELSAPGVVTSTLFTRAGTITELSLAFDQVMRPTVAFVEDGQAYLWWFDTAASSQVFTTLAADVVYPRVTLDDKRGSQRENSDVILAYLRGTTLYFRAQRDRYQTEYTLRTGLTAPLRKIALNQNLRLQFEFGPLVIE